MEIEPFLADLYTAARNGYLHISPSVEFHIQHRGLSTIAHINSVNVECMPGDAWRYTTKIGLKNRPSQFVSGHRNFPIEMNDRHRPHNTAYVLNQYATFQS